MATKVTLAAGTVIDDTEVYAIHTAATTIQVYLPPITAAGSDTDDDAPGFTHIIETTAAGTVEVLNDRGQRVAIVGPFQKVAFKALKVDQTWIATWLANVLLISSAQSAAAGSGTPILGTAAPTGSVDPDYWLEGVGPLGEAIVIPAWIKV